jgi:hypothetical protein
LFLGRHICEGRILRDGYTIDDVVDQIASGMDAAATLLHKPPSMTMLENPNLRADRYGNLVRDRIVLECSARHPKAELFTVVPKGDLKKPTTKRPLTERERPESSTARPGNELLPAHQPSCK